MLLVRPGTWRLLRGGIGLCLLLAASLSGSEVFAARPLSHFPVQVDGAVSSAPAVFDVTGDGRREIVLAAGSFLTVLRSDNSLVPGFPVFLESSIVGAVAVGEVGEQSEVAILAVTSDGRVHLLQSSGESWPGFPVEVGEAARAGGALFDLTGDGKVEVAAGGIDGLLRVWKLDGRPRLLSGFPVRIGAEVTSTPTFCDLGGDETSERTVLVGAGDGGLHAFDSRGRARPGFPARSRFLVSGQPACGDLTDDGVADAVFASQDYRLYAVNAAGRPLPGFPLETGYRIYGGPALVDLTGDGVPEIVFASSDSRLYAVDGRARPLPGFPVRLSSVPVGAVVAADLYRDGRQVLLVATDDMKLHAMDAEGRPLDGWPISLDGPPASGPTLADLVGDGYVEIILGTRDARVMALKARRRGEVRGSLAWATEGHDSRRSGWRHPNSARFHDLRVLPLDGPRSTDTLSPTWVWRHLDRLTEGEVDLRWFKNGEEVEALRGAREVFAEHHEKGQRWNFSVRALGVAGSLQTFDSPAVEIRNATPTRPQVRLAPETLRVGEELRAEIVEPATDPDGDPIQYLYVWFRDDDPVSLPRDAASVPAGRVRKGESWRVVVRAFDGVEEGPEVAALVVVENTLPSKPSVYLVPGQPAATDTIEVRIEEPAHDPDGDELSYRYRWWVDGALLNLDEGVSALPAGTVRKHQRVAVEVSAFDGDGEGSPGKASVLVLNTPPAPPHIAIEPSSPRTGESLRAAVRRAARDPDGDPVRYTFEWQLDGQPQEVLADVVDGERVRAGQKWSVVVRAHDDDGPGAAGSSEAVVVNTPPIPPVVVIHPVDPLPEQPLEARVVVAPTDRDGDEVSMSFVFSTEGREPIHGVRLPEGVTRKGELWGLTVTPHDGREAGTPARASVEIGNRPPLAPTVTIEPRRPIGGTSLTAVAPIPRDPDGDTVRLRSRWSVDGRHVPELDDKLEVPGRLVRRDEVWSVIVAATDGEAWSTSASDLVRVVRQPPRPPAVAVEPKAPTTTDDLRCAVVTPGRHPDDDAFETIFLWRRNGQDTAFAGATLPAKATTRGDEWACLGQVTAASGVGLGELSSRVTVANTPPSQPVLAVKPATPRRGDSLECGLVTPSVDADGDSISYAWSWTRNGRLVPGAEEPVLPAGRVERGEVWSCRVLPRDSVQAGPAAEVTTTIGNTPPTAPRVALAPEHPAEGDDLSCEVIEPAVDPDGGEVSYRFRWYENGELQPFPLTATSVRGRLIRADSLWRCGVSAHDGLEEGREGASSPVRVGPAGQEVAAVESGG